MPRLSHSPMKVASTHTHTQTENCVDCMFDKADQQNIVSLMLRQIPACALLIVCVFVCEGTEMMDSQLMGEFECDIKDLEADSWSGTVDKKFLKMLKKDEIKKQDVIYGKICCNLFW